MSTTTADQQSHHQKNQTGNFKNPFIGFPPLSTPLTKDTKLGSAFFRILKSDPEQNRSIQNKSNVVCYGLF